MIRTTIGRVMVFLAFGLPVAWGSPALSEMPDQAKPPSLEKNASSPPAIEGMVLVRGGCYDMGDKEEDETPPHDVCVSDFYLGMTEVTLGEYREFARETGYKAEGCFTWNGKEWGGDRGRSWRDPGFAQTDRDPVVCVNWIDAMAYIRWKSQKTGRTYRLPTEAEWEYAARSGGKRYKYGWGEGSPSGNVADESAKRLYPAWDIWSGYDDGQAHTAPVGSYRPNTLGLSDMTGNVWEWLGDWYGEGYYPESPRNNPPGPVSGRYRVIRGGSWTDDPWFLRVTGRYWSYPVIRDCSVGFRLAVSSKP